MSRPYLSVSRHVHSPRSCGLLILAWVLALLTGCTVVQADPLPYVDLSQRQPLPVAAPAQVTPLQVAVASVISPRGNVESFV